MSRNSVSSSKPPIAELELMNLLDRIGENRLLSPVLSDILPQLNIKETDLAKAMDNQSRKTTLKRLAVKIFCYVTARVPIVFIQDDVQWFDPISMEIIFQLTQECKNIGMLFFTRPIADIDVDFMSKIASMPSALHIVLQGLSLSETEEMIVQKLSAYGVKEVDPILLQDLYENTKGHPLQTDMLVGALFTTSEKSVVHVGSDGRFK
ncbi:hypothetical protein HDV05_003195, partial [Chytridiales sp. JEL 0842]